MEKLCIPQAKNTSLNSLLERFLLLLFICLLREAGIVWSCVHNFDNGSMINLMMVAAPKQYAPRFQNLHPQTNESNVYFYNPCYSYTYPPGGEEEACTVMNDVAVCMGSSEGFFNIGKQSRAKFMQDGESWSIHYDNPTGDRFTVVHLQCSYEHNDTLSVMGEIDDKSHKYVYSMTLYSHCACVDGCGYPVLPHGMSVGSFLLLLLLIFIITYITIGYLYRRFIIGARGIELLPHLSFWMDLPFLVQDGFFFLVKCGQNDMTYERI